MVKGFDERSAAVDRKHPYGGLPEEFVIVPAQALEGSEQDLHAPAGQPADKKIFRKKGSCLLHGDSMLHKMLFIRFLTFLLAPDVKKQ